MLENIRMVAVLVSQLGIETASLFAMLDDQVKTAWFFYVSVTIFAPVNRPMYPAVYASFS